MSDTAGRPAGFARVTVEDASQVPSARSLAVRGARDAGLPTAVMDRIALAATELATNLHRHAVAGELLLVRPPAGQEGSGSSLVLIAVDRGPGVEHFERCLVDGYTTAGSMGTGLGAVRRLASDFDAVSEPGRGTIVCAGFTVDPRARRQASAFDVAAVGFPIENEIENGDAYAAARRGSRLLVMVADGLGHGPLAAQASTAAVSEFAGLADQPPSGVLSELNNRIGATRGAAVSVASLDLDAAREGGEVVTSGFGNVSLLTAGPDGTTKRIVTAHGTAGARPGARTFEQSTPFPAHGSLVLHSDGLTSRWTLAGRAELLRHSSQAVTAALWRDHARGSDDTMVLVAKARVDREGR